MPTNKVHFTVVLDMSGVAYEAASYQEQRDKLRSVSNSKKWSPAAIRNSISEHELCGLAVKK